MTETRVEKEYKRHFELHKQGKCLKDCMVCQKLSVIQSIKKGGIKHA